MKCLWVSMVMMMVAVAGSHAADEIPFTGALADAKVTLPTLNNGQRDGLMLGNGDLYGVVYEKGNALYMRVTQNDIWDARMNTASDQPLPTVDLATGKMTSQGVPPSYNLPYPQPRCAAAITFSRLPMFAYCQTLRQSHRSI